MFSDKTLQSGPNPGAAFPAAPRIFSVCGNGLREDGIIAVLPSGPDRVERYLVDFPAFEPAVKTVSYFESAPLPGTPAGNRFAVVSVTAESINTPPVNHAAATGEIWSFKVWKVCFKPELELTADDALLADCRVTVGGMLDAFPRERFRCSLREIRPACGSPAKALPTGRTIRLRQRQLNL